MGFWSDLGASLLKSMASAANQSAKKFDKIADDGSFQGRALNEKGIAKAREKAEKLRSLAEKWKDD